jgi:hypothetical protein
MIGFELIEKLKSLDFGELEVVIRGENTVAGISEVYIDHDHTDDSSFIAIDLENEI